MYISLQIIYFETMTAMFQLPCQLRCFLPLGDKFGINKKMFGATWRKWSTQSLLAKVLILFNLSIINTSFSNVANHNASYCQTIDIVIFLKVKTPKKTTLALIYLS